MSQEGFVRLQGLTHRVEAAMKQKVLKTKQQSDTEVFVLIQQTQDGRPDIFIKQLWVSENGEWRLDDEQKRSAESPAPASPPVTAPSTPVDGAKAPTPAITPTSLPGMSN